jgi:hypothetical protein
VAPEGFTARTTVVNRSASSVASWGPSESAFYAGLFFNWGRTPRCTAVRSHTLPAGNTGQCTPAFIAKRALSATKNLQLTEDKGLCVNESSLSFRGFSIAYREIAIPRPAGNRAKTVSMVLRPVSLPPIGIRSFVLMTPQGVRFCPQTTIRSNRVDIRACGDNLG